jgi:hypothetical protein
MGATGHIVPPELGNSFHEYDRVLRQNLALRRVHGPLDGDAGRPPTGAPLTVLREENERMRVALEKRSLEAPRVSEGAVQPTTMLDRPRRHIPVPDAKVCPQCGELRAKSVCRCGYSWAPRLRRGGIRTGGFPTWDSALGWLAGGLGMLVVLFWLLQPILR